MKKQNKHQLRRLVTSNFNEDDLDEWYEEQLVQDQKQRNKEKARHGFKEEIEGY